MPSSGRSSRIICTIYQLRYAEFPSCFFIGIRSVNFLSGFFPLYKPTSMLISITKDSFIATHTQNGCLQPGMPFLRIVCRSSFLDYDHC